jgi:hypothetical protein
MRRTAAPLAATLLIGTAAGAQYASAPPGVVVMEPERLKAVRLMIGVSGITNGYYCAYGYTLAYCDSGYQYEAAPFTFGGEFELGNRALAVAIGVYDMTAPYNDINRNFVEPLADLVFRLGTYNAGAIFRLRLGAGFYIGPDGNTGFVGRGGFGLSFRGRGRLGLAMEVAYEYGAFEGYGISVIRFLAGPEYAF